MTHHGHDHEQDLDWESLGQFLEREGELHDDVFTGAAAWLSALTQPRRILDLGSGPGVATCVLARAFPDAEVVAVDAATPLLDRVHARAAR